MLNEIDKKKHLVIVTTVPETLNQILASQPNFLSCYYNITLISSPGVNLELAKKREGVSAIGIRMERGISPLRDLVAIFTMIMCLRKIKPDLIHSYTPKAGLVSMIASYLVNTPVRIHTFTGLIFPYKKGLLKKILIVMDRLICRLATHIVPEGNGVKNDLLNNDITSKDINVIGCGNISGVDVNYFDVKNVNVDVDKFKFNKGIEKKSFLYIYIGRFTLDKGFRELLEAFDNLASDVDLILVGEQDKREPLPDYLLEKIKDNERVHDFGFLDDIRPALAISDVLILPSYREGFPNTPLQAGSMKVPSIVTDISGSNEIILDGYNGWVIPTHDSSLLTQAMCEAQQCEWLRDKGDNARLNVKAKFERSDYLSKLLQFYIDCIRNKNL